MNPLDSVTSLTWADIVSETSSIVTTTSSAGEDPPTKFPAIVNVFPSA